MYIFTILLLSFLSIKCEINVREVTRTAFENTKHSTIAAFGDVNADRFTDILVITKNGKGIDVLLSDKKAGFSRKKFLESLEDYKIYGVIPTDFNGDAQMDVLVTYYNEGKYSIGIHYGKPGESVVQEKAIWLTIDSEVAKFRDEPFLFDENFDMYPDILGEVGDGDSIQRIVWKIDKQNHYNFTGKRINFTNELIRPHSSAFLDLESKSSGDYVLTTVKNSGPSFEYYVSSSPGNPRKISKPSTKAEFYGQSSFADLNQNTFANQILPLCGDEQCKDSQIWVYLNEFNWTQASRAFIHKKSVWGFNVIGNGKNLVKLRMGDFDSDGYEDSLVVLYNITRYEKTKELESRAFILYNRRCTESYCRILGRCFEIDWSSGLSENVTVATFFDYKEDGKLDVLVQTDTLDESEPNFRLYESRLDADVCFMKVMVTNGICFKNCKNGIPPYGVNVPGPSIKYDTVNINDRRQKSFGAQLSQSAHRALQLPYVHFGLGQTPNFLDKLVIGIPSNTTKREKELTTIIPNSRIIIIPHPNNKPSSWADKLFVNPGIKVYITGGSLLGTCIFVAIIVGILHWKERSDDKKEKRQDAHKFHFDAM